MGKLTILCEWALALLEPMLAELSFVFLLQSIELALVSVEVVIVGLLSEVSHDFSWWIIEVPWSSLSVVTFSLVARFLTSRIVLALRVCIKIRCAIGTVGRLRSIIDLFIEVNLLDLLGSLRIRRSLLLVLPLVLLRLNVLLLFGLLFLFTLLRSVAYHFFKSV